MVDRSQLEREARNASGGRNYTTLSEINRYRSEKGKEEMEADPIDLQDEANGDFTSGV